MTRLFGYQISMRPSNHWARAVRLLRLPSQLHIDVGHLWRLRSFEGNVMRDRRRLGACLHLDIKDEETTRRRAEFDRAQNFEFGVRITTLRLGSDLVVVVVVHLTPS